MVLLVLAGIPSGDVPLSVAGVKTAGRPVWQVRDLPTCQNTVGLRKMVGGMGEGVFFRTDLASRCAGERRAVLRSVVGSCADCADIIAPQLLLLLHGPDAAGDCIADEARVLERRAERLRERAEEVLDNEVQKGTR